MPDTIINGQCAYKTKPLTLEMARRFSRMLLANSRFRVLEIAPAKPRKADPERCWSVLYVPSAPEKLDALRERQQERRRIRAVQQEDNYEITLDDGERWFNFLNLKNQKTYEVTLESCNCEDHEIRLRGSGCPCKHRQILARLIAANSTRVRDDEREAA